MMLVTDFAIRGAMSFIAAFIFVLVAVPLFIRLTHKKKLLEKIKVESQIMKAQSAGKENTPTMGGIVIFGGFLFSLFICGDWQNTHLIFAVITAFIFAILGVSDDLIKAYSKHKGLRSRSKLLISILLSVGVCTYFKSQQIHFLSQSVYVGSTFFVCICILIMTSTCHAVNLTDGLDGLAAGCTTLVMIYFAIVISIWSQNSGINELAISNFAMCGSCCAFLWYNCYPAKIFMGDCGALMLGAYISYIAISCQQEMMLAIVGMIFVVEALSSLVQILSRKFFDHRVFLCAPLHHHLRAKGHNEAQLVVRFWIVQFFLVILSLVISARGLH